MLELQKFVLEHVGEDARLFKKELMKSISWLSFPDTERLKQWVYHEFGNKHPEIIQEAFQLIES